MYVDFQYYLRALKHISSINPGYPVEAHIFKMSVIHQMDVKLLIGTQ